MSVLNTSAPRGQTELVASWRLSVGDYIAAADVLGTSGLAVLGLGDGSIVGVELSRGREVFRRKAHEGGVLAVSASPDGTHFVTGGQEPKAKLWEASGRLVRELEGGSSAWVEHVAWSPVDGRLSTAAGKILRVWSDSGELIRQPEPLASTVSAVGWRGDGTAVAAACYGGVHIWPFVPGAKDRHLAWKGSLISLAWSFDGKIIACGSQDKTIHFWRLAKGHDSEMSGYPFKSKALAWDAESKLLATAGDTAATLWDFRGKGPEGTQPIRLGSHHGLVTCLAFHGQKSLLASGSQDTSVLLWEPRRSTRPVRYGFVEDEVTILKWLPVRAALLGGDASGCVALWEVG